MVVKAWEIYSSKFKVLFYSKCGIHSFSLVGFLGRGETYFLESSHHPIQYQNLSHSYLIVYKHIKDNHNQNFVLIEFCEFKCYQSLPDIAFFYEFLCGNRHGGPHQHRGVTRLYENDIVSLRTSIKMPHLTIILFDGLIDCYSSQFPI